MLFQRDPIYIESMYLVRGCLFNLGFVANVKAFLPPWKTKSLFSLPYVQQTLINQLWKAHLQSCSSQNFFTKSKTKSAFIYSRLQKSFINDSNFDYIIALSRIGNLLEKVFGFEFPKSSKNWICLCIPNKHLSINLGRLILEVVHLRFSYKHRVGDSCAPFIFGMTLVLT